MLAPRIAKAQTKDATSSPDKLAQPRNSLIGQARMPQWDIGNQATTQSASQTCKRLTGNEPGDNEPGAGQLAGRPGMSWNFGRISIFAPDRASQPPAIPQLTATPLLSAIQPKLALGPVDDPLEREADRAAEHVMRMPVGVFSPAAFAPAQVSRKCGDCEEQERLRRKPESSMGGMVAAPGIVHEGLRSPGKALATGIRAYFEPRFGRDFSGVRLHDDSQAAASAQAVGAKAYAVGRDIVFGAGHSATDLPLLAHELAHVVQQRGDAHVLRRFASCRELLDAPAAASVSENDVQESLIRDARRLGRAERELDVPAGSAAPWRTEPWRGTDDTVIEPQELSEIFDIAGRADIVLLNGTTLEVLEVKAATWPDSLFAETQVVNYVTKGNRAIGEMQRIWRARKHGRDTITAVRAMPKGTIDLSIATRRIGGRPVSLAWCRNGVIVFKARGTEDREVLYCGIRDRGRTDAFLSRMLGPAQNAAEKFIAEQFVAEQSAAEQSVKNLDPAAKGLMSRLLKQPKVKTFLRAHEKEVNAAVEALVHMGTTALRQQIQTEIRSLLEESAMILCASVAEMTAAELLSALLGQLQNMLRDPNYILVPLTLPAAFMSDPAPAPQGESGGGESFREKMSRLTGLTGIGLTAYLIISEGSRIVFPPRNLIPAP